jgi:type I restriction enzyme M protein
MARMNAFIHDMEADIALGDTMTRPSFLRTDGGLRQFDIITANPMWNQDFAGSVYENDTFGRFTFGIPPSGSGDWGWLQHLFASLSEKGRMAVVLDTGAVSRGSGNEGANKERDIRKIFVDRDWIEAVLLLPENLFYNTTASGIVIVINKCKKHKGEVLLINGESLFKKGRPKNFMETAHVERIAAAYQEWKDEESFSAVVKTDEITKNDYNLSVSRYIASSHKSESVGLPDAWFAFLQAEKQASEASLRLKSILKDLISVEMGGV